MNARQSFLLGVKTIAPLVLGVVPFGLLYGVVAVKAGADVVQAAGMSVFIFAGAAQLAAAQLMAESAPLWVVVATALVINARFAMYSASLAPQMEQVAPRARWFLSFFLTDQAYAACTIRFMEETRQGIEPVRRAWFFAGSAVAMYPVWQASTLLGAGLGSGLSAGLPREFELEFAAPLTFLALLMPTLTSRPSVAAAVVAGTVSVAARGLPLNLSILAAAGAGILTGVVLETRSRA